jgi:hypothetical protein
LTRENAELRERKETSEVPQRDHELEVIVENLQAAVEAGVREKETIVAQLNSRLDAAESECVQLRSEIEGMADYATVKHELSVLKSLEFDEVDPPLEQLLLEKLRKMEGNLMSANVVGTYLGICDLLRYLRLT